MLSAVVSLGVGCYSSSLMNHVQLNPAHLMCQMQNAYNDWWTSRASSAMTFGGYAAGPRFSNGAVLGTPWHPCIATWVATGKPLVGTAWYPWFTAWYPWFTAWVAVGQSLLQTPLGRLCIACQKQPVIRHWPSVRNTLERIVSYLTQAINRLNYAENWVCVRSL